MRKVILDTNVFLSGILFGGISAQLLGGIQNRKFALCTSRQLYNEIYDKLVYKFYVDKSIIRDVSILLSYGIIFSPKKTVHFREDEKDAYLLELAQESKADYIVTGDKKHLLPLKKWKSTRILSPREAKEVLL